MKFLVILLFVVINLFGCNFSVLTKNPFSNDDSCSEKRYKPKSEAIVASMTTRQLIDELIQFRPNEFRTYEELTDYRISIEKRIRQAGVKALPIFTEYFENSYHKQSAFDCDKSRFDRVDNIAWDLDRFDFRLRGTDKGKLTIDAFERAIKRVEKPGFTKKAVSYYRKTLNDLKGINHYDISIQETFWVRYGLEMSKSELVEFSNFLINLDPTYPSWSDRDFIKDYSRINEAGNPRQVRVMKNPERFYKAYLEFKKTKR